jgi:hypothetical protein
MGVDGIGREHSHGTRSRMSIGVHTSQTLYIEHRHTLQRLNISFSYLVLTDSLMIFSS